MQAIETAHEQAGGHQHDDRQRELGGDEHPAKAIAARRSGRSSPGVLQRSVQIETSDAHRRREAEQEARRDAEDQGEEEHLAVDGDVAEPRDARRLQPLNRAHRNGRQRDAGGAAEQRQPDALGQQLAHDPKPARAHRGAHGHLALTRERSRQQQVRDIRARDQQHDPDRRQQHCQRRAHVAHHLLEQRHDRERQSAVGRVLLRMLLPQPRGDQIHLGLRRRHGHARLQRADHVIVLAVAASRRGRRQRQRQIDIAVLGDAEGWQHLAWQREARLQDADDPARLAVQRDRRADDARIQSIPPRPGAVAEHGGARRPRRIFFWCEQPPHRRLRAEHRQQIRRNANHANPLRIAASGQRVVAADGNRDLLEPADGRS